jgi:hypothetical protein
VINLGDARSPPCRIVPEEIEGFLRRMVEGHTDDDERDWPAWTKHLFGLDNPIWSAASCAGGKSQLDKDDPSGSNAGSHASIPLQATATGA